MTKLLFKAFLLIALLSINLAYAETRPYRYAGYLPVKHPTITHGAKPFVTGMAALKEPVIYKTFSGGALLGADNMLAGLQHNLADVGQIIFLYYPAQFPYMNIMAELAMVGSFAPAVSAASTEFLWTACEPCRLEAKQQGIVVLGLSSTSPYYPISTEPLQQWSDLRHRRVRSPGAGWDRWIVFTGSAPIVMSSGETYEALTRGQLDVVMTSMSSLRTASLWDAARHVTKLPIGTYRPIGSVVMSESHWANLSDQQKLAAARLGNNAAIGVGQGYMESDTLAEKRFTEMNISVHEPTEEMFAKRAAFIDMERSLVIQSLTERWGMKNIEHLVDVYLELNAKWHTKFLPLKDDPDAMADMLWEEVMAPAMAREYGLKSQAE